MNSEDRFRLWLAVYAIGSFERSADACRLLLATCPTNQHPLFGPLSAAVHVFYGRPFHRSHGIERRFAFQEEDVPQAFRGRHEFLLSFRDKVVAHVDADTKETFGSEIHDVEVSRVNGEWTVSCAMPTARREAYVEALGVIEAMRVVAMIRFEKVRRQNESSFPADDGIYRLELSCAEPFTKV